MLDRSTDLHTQTDTQLELALIELRANIAYLQDTLQNLGASAVRDQQLAQQRALIENVQRELSHRRKPT